MLNPELKKKWVDALRSGEYIQTQEVLHNRQDNSYCCLGVLAEVEKFPEWDGNVFIWEEETEEGGLIPREDEMELPPIILHRLGLGQDDQLILIRMNDGGLVNGEAVKPHDFDTIADYIEANL